MGAIGELSLPAVDILWEDLRLGGFPFPLEVPAHGDTIEERARIRAAVHGQLERRGLTRGGTLDPGLEHALHLLAKPKLTLDLVALLDMRDAAPVRAVVAARGKFAVLAVQKERLIALSPVRETAIVGSIVDLLPEVHAGPGQSVTLPSAMLNDRPLAQAGRHRRAESEDGPVLLRAAPIQSMHHNEIRYVHAVMERPTLRAGAIGIVLRDGQGKTHRLPGIGFFDTDQGRYATTVRHESGGEAWTTLSPVDNARLAHRLAETLVEALRR